MSLSWLSGMGYSGRPKVRPLSARRGGQRDPHHDHVDSQER